MSEKMATLVTLALRTIKPVKPVYMFIMSLGFRKVVATLTD
jgi:hypothetical protein